MVNEVEVPNMNGNGVEGYAGIEREIIELILQRKFFYGHFLQQFKRHNVDHKHADPSAGKVVHTLAVNITSDLKPNLFVNTSFYNSGDYDPDNPNKHTWGLTQDEKLALLEHEILHMLNKHLIRIENRDSYVWNVATDLAINQYIKGLPDGARCPDCNIFVRKIAGGQFPHTCPLCKRQLDPNKHKCQPLQIKGFDVGAEKMSLDANNPSESYYDILWKKLPKQVILCGRGMTDQREKEARDGLKDSGGMGQGQGESEGQSSGSSGGSGGQQQQQAGGGSGQQPQDNDGQGKDEKKQEAKEEEGKSGDSRRDLGSGIIEIDGMKVPIAIDNHEAWQAGADNKEMAHQKVKDMVEKAMHRVNQKSQGHLPDYVRGLIDAVLAHKTVNWKSELRKFVGYEEFAQFISSRKRINRRFPIVQPGYVVQRKAHFVVAVDSSGSIDDEEFAKFFKEISIMHAAKLALTYVECDADIQKVEEYKRKPKLAQHERIGYGGTDFRPVFEFVKKRYWKNGAGKEFKLKGNKKVDGIIYLTDGMGSYPSPRDIICPVIWVMTPNHSDYGWSEKIGKKIVMEDD